MPTLLSESADVERKLWTAEGFLDWLQPKVHADLISSCKFTHSPVSVRHALPKVTDCLAEIMACREGAS